MFRTIIIVAATLACITGCTTVNHIDSQRRLFEGVSQLQQAEARDSILISQASSIAASQDATYLTVESLRQSLANDAMKDISAARTGLANGIPADRISALFRASIKAWHAGAAGKNAADTATSLGANLCNAQGAAAPPRDCAMLRVATYLNTMETEVDRLLRYDALRAAERLEDIQSPSPTQVVAQLTRAVVVIDRNLKEVQNLTTDAPEDFVRWLGRERYVYACWAVRAQTGLRQIRNAASIGEASELARNASDAIEDKAQPSDALVQMTGRSKTEIRGALIMQDATEAKTKNRGILNRFNRDYPGVLDPKSRDASCNKLFNENSKSITSG